MLKYGGMEGSMAGWDKLDTLFIVWAFFFQLSLIVHFALRKRYFDSYTLKYGWILYALCIPAMIVSVILLVGGKSWSFWLGGFLFIPYACYGYYVDYIKQISWRNPPVVKIMLPYVMLYLATVTFYWWPLALIDRPLWYIYAGAFVVSTILNVTSH